MIWSLKNVVVREAPRYERPNEKKPGFYEIGHYVLLNISDLPIHVAEVILKSLHCISLEDHIIQDLHAVLLSYFQASCSGTIGSTTQLPWPQISCSINTCYIISCIFIVTISQRSIHCPSKLLQCISGSIAFEIFFPISRPISAVILWLHDCFR